MLGLLNSNLLFRVLKNISNVFRGGWITCTNQYFSQLPISVVNPLIKFEQTLHHEIVRLVDTILKLQQQRQASTLPGQFEHLEQRIAQTDAVINQKVYALYNLTEEEIKVIEGEYKR